MEQIFTYLKKAVFRLALIAVFSSPLPVFSADLTIFIPSTAFEGDGFLNDVGTLILSETTLSDLVVDLTSSDATEVTVSASITIPAGHDAAIFDLTIINDNELDGDQSVTISASSPGFEPVSATIVVIEGYRDGLEFQVNTFTDGNQSFPSIAVLPGGWFIIVWQSEGQDGSGYGIFVQIFSRSGFKVGKEFMVNSYTKNDQTNPCVATLGEDRFVAVWESEDQDGGGKGVYGQLLSKTGAKIGNEFRINTFTSDDQRSPAIAGLTNGNFVVTWESKDPDGSSNSYYIYGQLFDSEGSKIGNEFNVSSNTGISQTSPSVADLCNGGFIITWRSNGYRTSSISEPFIITYYHYSGHIEGQLFDIYANKVGNPFKVSKGLSSTFKYGPPGSPSRPSVASLENGNFVVSWKFEFFLENHGMIYAQSYNNTGLKVGSELAIKEKYLDLNGSVKTVAGLPGERYVVTWNRYFGYKYEYSEKIYGQVCDNKGIPVTQKFLLNTDLQYEKSYPSVAESENGFIATWVSYTQDGSVDGIYGQMFVATDEGSEKDSDDDLIFDYIESSSCTNPYDMDSDNDGIFDGDEDTNQNGVVDPGETDPCNPDTDGDGIQDGTELGIFICIPDPDNSTLVSGTDPAVFIPDADEGATTTDPTNDDTDGDGIPDGEEDANHNGQLDPGESDPLQIPKDLKCISAKVKATAKLCKGLTKCYIKRMKNPAKVLDFSCFLDAEAKAESDWDKAEERAARKGKNCITPEPTEISDRVQSVLEDIQADISQNIDYDDYKKSNKLNQSLMKAMGKYVSDVLKAEALDIKQTKKNKRNAALSRADAKLIKKWNKAINKSRVNYTGPSSGEVGDMLDDLVLQILKTLN